MLRIKDPKPSLEFYQNVLGMNLLTEMRVPEMSFSIYFLGHADRPFAPFDEAKTYLFDTAGVLGLRHEWGTESDPAFEGYHTGNTEPLGFKHFAFLVDDVVAACARFESLGVQFAKRLEDGTIHNVAFIVDPDGYHIEIIPFRFQSV
jgi:lactoylglutathione lyase